MVEEEKDFMEEYKEGSMARGISRGSVVRKKTG